MNNPQHKSSKLSKINTQLQHALSAQQKVSQMVIQKDLELAKTNNQLDRQVKQLKVFQEVVSKVRGISDRDRALDIIARSLILDLHFSAALIVLGLDRFKVAAKHSDKDIKINHLEQHPLIKKANKTNVKILVQDINQASPEEKRLAHILQLTSFCVLPLQIRTKHYGLFICGLEDPCQQLSVLDIEFLEIVANSIAITLENLKTEERQRSIDKLKSEFVAIASHQLRTPLSVIKWTLKMFLNGDLGKLTREQKEFLEKTYKSNEQMINLVNDLLDVSRIEEGKLEYKFVKFDLGQLLKEVLEQYKVTISRKKLRLESVIDKAGKIILKGDREKLFLTFNNIVDNAIKFTPKGGKLSVLIKEHATNVEVIIKDTGIGISREDQEQIFTKFFRSDQAKRMQTQGTGLGLFIVKNIIQAHHGKVTVKSKLGKGTVFRCVLPRGE